MNDYKIRIGDMLSDKAFIDGKCLCKNSVYGGFNGITVYPPNGLAIYLPPQPIKMDDTFLNFVSNNSAAQTLFYKENTNC
jgi:hypothetical protein